MSAHSSDRRFSEEICPIALDLLARLLRADGELRTDLIGAIPDRQRAALAFFCYSRVHLRTLAFDIVLECEMKDLRQIAGAKGDLLRQQAIDHRESADRTPDRFKGITLARRAAG